MPDIYSNVADACVETLPFSQPPIYHGALTESIRAFLDRLRRACMDQAGVGSV